MTDLGGRPREYFAPELQDEWLRRWGDPSIGSYADFVAMVIERGTTRNGVFGCKLHWYQFPHLLASLRRLDGNGRLSDSELLEKTFPNLNYIWLRRLDKVRQTVSYYRASRSGRWWDVCSSGNGHGTDEADGVQFDFAAIDRLRDTLLIHEGRWRRFFTVSRIQPTEVTYEELAKSYEATTIRVLRSVSVQIPSDLVIGEPRLKRQGDQVSELWVKQYRELKWGKSVGCAEAL